MVNEKIDKKNSDNKSVSPTGDDFRIKVIGVVKNKAKSYTDPFKFSDIISKIEIFKEYEEGLINIDRNEYIQVIYYFHKSPPIKKLSGLDYFGKFGGVFTTRSPVRPTPIGISTAKLISIEGNILTVKGLDALDGTPVLDIKPYVPGLDEREIARVERDDIAHTPRKRIWAMIRNNDLEGLLHLTAAFHGHYCGGLALGVMMATRAMRELGAYNKNDGMENVLAIVEMNHCAVDAIQFITGCTFGNNALIFKDLGKTALSLVQRGDGNAEGVRIWMKNLPWEKISEPNKELDELFEKVVERREGAARDNERLKILMRDNALKVIGKRFEEIFNIRKITIPSPDWAPIHDSIICDECNESVMASRAIQKDGKSLCLICADEPYYEVSGSGIVQRNKKVRAKK